MVYRVLGFAASFGLGLGFAGFLGFVGFPGFLGFLGFNASGLKTSTV